ncbi:MAG: hypothetical protein JWL73_3586 [Actinomycetia bacterium]|nr:hypothetical protein [Actinomycetes bacterium]
MSGKIYKPMGVLFILGGIAFAVVGVMVPLILIPFAICAIAFVAMGVLFWWLAGVMAVLPKRPKFGPSMRNAAAAMNNATTMMHTMAGTDDRVNQLKATGVDAVATILAVRDTGTLVNFDPVLDIDLLVRVGDQPPFPATSRECVGKVVVGRLAPGAAFACKVDPASNTNLFVDWDRLQPVA